MSIFHLGVAGRLYSHGDSENFFTLGHTNFWAPLPLSWGRRRTQEIAYYLRKINSEATLLKFYHLKLLVRTRVSWPPPHKWPSFTTWWLIYKERPSQWNSQTLQSLGKNSMVPLGAPQSLPCQSPDSCTQSSQPPSYKWSNFTTLWLFSEEIPS